MEIPGDIYSLRGVIPHHLPDWPENPEMPPYTIQLKALAQHFTYSPARAELFRGLLGFRKALKARGVTGTQWIDGSFVQAESIYGRDPEDIDILTWVSCDSMEHFEQLVSGIDSDAIETEHHCHVFFQPAPWGFIPWPVGAYWLWLFGHTNTAKVINETDRGLAKGFFAIDLADSEEDLSLGGGHAQA